MKTPPTPNCATRLPEMIMGNWRLPPCAQLLNPPSGVHVLRGRKPRQLGRAHGVPPFPGMRRLSCAPRSLGEAITLPLFERTGETASLGDSWEMGQWDDQREGGSTPQEQRNKKEKSSTEGQEPHSATRPPASPRGPPFGWRMCPVSSDRDSGPGVKRRPRWE
ncbi:hypothetical protein SKAU_G00319510 [Synaphobranchus kaupii]|uniref:Uncharacterized protein n=1 Tax=Synaphobranchus kaupii TaxID=118154 RepID=A0A9Q1END7_SYNKA|nr:hypothetical protein SKAU_G00319510 [Synaphobranchus kaupii]